jgi:hypothetical protein
MTQSHTIEPLTCVHCKKNMAGYFEVTRVENSGARRGTVRVCSLVCLLNWAYALTLKRGVQGAQLIRNAFISISEALKGPR